jgi:electron transfer flavoprotein alpha subunit
MADTLFAYVLHSEGKVDDTAFELITAARKIDPVRTVTGLVLGSGAPLEKACGALTGFFEEVWKIDHPSLSYPNAEMIREALTRILPKKSLVLVPHEHFGMDLSPGLSIKLDAAYLADVAAIDGIEENRLKVVREEFNGQVSTHMSLDLSEGAVITLRPGSFKPDESRSVKGQIVDKTGAAFEGGPEKTRRRFIELVEAEMGDVDITKSEVLVSVGRGIEEEENLEIVNQLAKVMGADVSCSRPIVDAKWLEKSRQVGTSGQTVKPKVYLALGISGSFQHMGGIKGSPFVLAINKNAKAPIFQSADVGVVADILDFVPKLTEKIKELK